MKKSTKFPGLTVSREEYDGFYCLRFEYGRQQRMWQVMGQHITLVHDGGLYKMGKEMAAYCETYAQAVAKKGARVA